MGIRRRGTASPGRRRTTLSEYGTNRSSQGTRHFAVNELEISATFTNEEPTNGDVATPPPKQSIEGTELTEFVAPAARPLKRLVSKTLISPDIAFRLKYAPIERYDRRRRKIDLLAVIFAGSSLAFWFVSMHFAGDSHFANAPKYLYPDLYAEIFKCLVLLCSLALFGTIAAYYDNEHKEINRRLSQKFPSHVSLPLWRNRRMMSFLLLEILVCLVQPIPFVTWHLKDRYKDCAASYTTSCSVAANANDGTNPMCGNGTCHFYPLAPDNQFGQYCDCPVGYACEQCGEPLPFYVDFDKLGIFLLLRSYLVIRLMRDFSEVFRRRHMLRSESDQEAKYVKFGWYFSLRYVFYIRPVLFTASLVIFFAGILAYIMYILEMGYHYDEGPSGGFTPTDSIYFIFITMTTVGYGDISPQSDFGRACAIITAIIGLFLTSIVIAQVSDSLALKDNELELVKELSLKQVKDKERVWAASKIKSAWLKYRESPHHSDYYCPGFMSSTPQRGKSQVKKDVQKRAILLQRMEECVQNHEEFYLRRKRVEAEQTKTNKDVIDAFENSFDDIHRRLAALEHFLCGHVQRMETAFPVLRPDRTQNDRKSH